MNLQVRLENGEEIKAPLAEWVAGIIQLLTPQQRAQLCESMRKKIIGYQTPGSHILRAEGGLIMAKQGQ